MREERRIVNFYRFWYAAYTLRAELKQIPQAEVCEATWFNYREFIDIIKCEAKNLFPYVNNSTKILCDLYDQKKNNDEITFDIPQIEDGEDYSNKYNDDYLNMDGGIFYKYIHVDSGEFSLMIEDGNKGNALYNENAKCDEDGLPIPNQSDYRSLEGIGTFLIDISLPIESITFYFERMQKAKFNRPPFTVPHFLQPGELEYNIAYNVLKRIEIVKFAYKSAISRAIGLWLWDQVNIYKTYNSINSAIRALENGENIPKDMLSIFGLDDTPDTSFSRMYLTTERCIREREVLKIGSH